MSAFRIPFPSERALARGMDKQQWGVLLNSVFPGAKTADAILDAWDLAKVRDLNTFAGHVAIVTQSRNVDGKWVEHESCWLTLKALVYTAHRTNAFAGIDPIKFGPMVERVYTGHRRNRGGQNETSETKISVPEYVTATVYRFVGGVRCAFSETIFFDEAVPLAQGMPTSIWAKKPALMLAKCAKAAALRIGFAECDYSADEMDGQQVVPDIAPDQHLADYGQSDMQDAATSQVAQHPAFEQEFGESIASFQSLSLNTLKWLDRTIETAVNLGAFEEAIANIRSTLNADSHDIAETLVRSADTIASCQIGSRIWNYIGQARNHPSETALDTAAKTLGDQAASGKITDEVHHASVTVIDFLKALKKAA